MQRRALYDLLEGYRRALAGHDPAAVPWTDAPLTSENNVMLEVGDGLWGTIESFGRYELRFADPETGQVGFFGTVQEPREESAYTVRLKLTAAGRIAEAETIVVRQSDSGIKFENSRFEDKPVLQADAEQPTPRVEMVALANGYFDTMQQNDGTLHTRFHPDCSRVENGVQTTRNPDFAHVVPVAALGCEEQFRMGNYRYDDRLRGRRFPLVDEQRGLVMAFGFIDHCGVIDEYPLTDGRVVKSPVRRPHSFYLAELFKIDGGLIRQIEAHFITVPYHMPSPWEAL